MPCFFFRVSRCFMSLHWCTILSINRIFTSHKKHDDYFDLRWFVALGNLPPETTLSLHQAGSLGRKWCEPIIKLMEPTSLGGVFAGFSRAEWGVIFKKSLSMRRQDMVTGVCYVLNVPNLSFLVGITFLGSVLQWSVFFFNLLFLAGVYNQGDVYQPSWKEITANS